MDDIQPSRTSDAAATRKRRSSILKSQRPPRTPFSELEFNVATPTDTSKSRRVSFSRRTGVAEFATNEATTTWKNFYEEHNKSLESSGNDSGPKQPVRYLGNRIFDQQFEEVEADFIGIHNTVSGPNINISASLNNFENQLISLESTDDIKLTAPHNNFELSEITNINTKLFDELAIPDGGVTDRIDVNFSAVQQIGGDDDLDEIQNDLKQRFCPSAFNRQNMSEYIEVDLNMTQIVKNDDDISITDTVNSSHVKDLTKNSSSNIEMGRAIDINFSNAQQNGNSDDLDEIEKDLHQKFGFGPYDNLHGQKFQENKSNTSKNTDNWVVDKENIAINPYAALREKENFAINDESDKVLVFDGKRLTIQSEKVDKESCRQTVVVNPLEKAQRKTIVLNVNDDLPNFVDDLQTAHTSGLMDISNLKKSIVLDDILYDSDLADVQAVPSNVLSEDKRRTIIYEGGTGNISVTQAVSTNVAAKRRTIVYDNNDGNMSITQALPTNVVKENKTNVQQNDKRKTIVYDDGNMSITQALPTNLLKENKTNIHQNDKRKTIVYDDGNMSITQAIPTNLLPENTTKRRTILYEDNAANLSITQAVPNILITEAKAEKHRTIVYQDETGDISVTQPIPSNINIAENSNDRRRTVVFENDTGNISVTQAVPSNLILQEKVNNINVLETVPSNATVHSRRRTIVYENDTGNLSITQAVPNHIIQGIQNQIPLDERIHDGKFTNIEFNNEENKRRTVVFDNDDADISLTQAVSLNQVICAIRNEQQENQIEMNKENKSIIDGTNKRRTIVFDNDDADISMTQAVPVNIVQCFNPFNKATSEIQNSNPFDEGNKSRTVVFENGEADVSTTQIVTTNQLPPGIEKQNVYDDLEAALNEALHARQGKSERTIVYDKENGNISITQNLQDINMSLSQSIRDNVMENVLKQRTVVTDDVAKMKNGTNVNFVADFKQSNSEYGRLLDPNTSDVFDVSMAEINVQESENNCDASIKATHQTNKVIWKPLNPIHQSVNSITKPIPSDLFTIKTKNSEKSFNKDKSAVCEEKCVTEVLVYQAALTKLTEQGDSKVKEPVAVLNDEKLSSSSKIPDENELIRDDDMTSASSKVISENEEKNTEMTEEKQEPQNEMHDFVTEQDQSIPNDEQSHASTDSTSQMSKSILNDLLDMTSLSVEGIEDKGLMAQVDAQKETTAESAKEEKSNAETDSNDVMFTIIRDDDSDREVQTEHVKDPQITEHKPLPLEYKDEPAIVVDVQTKIEEIKDKLNDDNSSKNRHYKKILSTDLDMDKSKGKESNSKASKSFKAANDTNELLDMLSDLTDKTMTRKLDAHLEEDEYKPQPILIKGHLALENKSECDPEPKRLSFAPSRHSIMLSREDLLNNISKAAVMKSQIDFDDSELDDSVDESLDNSNKKSARVSNDVVKTLQFDETISESSNTETKMTPLKKTAFGETSYMRPEPRAKVIPDFLKNVSDGIKELMDDLVKPNADVLPFDAGMDTMKQTSSTHSTQIQANLITSSQVDLNAGLYSEPASIHEVNINKVDSFDIINDAVNRSVTRALKNPIKSIMSTPATRSSEKSLDSKVEFYHKDVRTIIPSTPKEVTPGRVLIFDQNNPLNNILLAPETFTDVHKYNPIQSTESINASERSNSAQIDLNEKETDHEVERVSTQYNVGSTKHSVKHSGDENIAKIGESQSNTSNLSRRMSLDKSTDVKLNVKDNEINTLIAMKGNKELLEASSSLTLVDDALARSNFDVDVDTRTTTSREETSKSPVRIIYAVDQDDMLSDKLDSDITSNDESEDRAKPTKRTFTPTRRDKHRHCTMSNLDITPKPISKMQKLSESPGYKVKQSESKSKNEKKNKPSKSKSKKPGTSITVQQLITGYNLGPIDTETIDEQIKGLEAKSASSVEPRQTASQSDVECRSLDMLSSFASSKNLREAAPSQSSKVSRMEWQSEILDDVISKNSVMECESGVNVVAKIDMLPFMGSHECEWDSCGGDTWSFRLLHARLRLWVRLEHRHENAARTRVRADTRVRSVTLEVLPHESKNTIAVLCVTFAAETMRYFINRGCACAGDVPALVRRCAAAARLAARWGRVMCDAKLHLAYCVTADGLLTLKVANIPLRSVWEVTLQLELVVEDAREAPWVRAGEVRVRRVLCASPAEAPPPRVTRLLSHLPRDWSHAPRAIWRIFKYLKHKTRDDTDDELFMGL